MNKASHMAGAQRWPRPRTLWSRAFRWLSGEVLLSCWANCGTLIAFRSFWASCVICMAGLLLTNSLDPTRSAPPEWRELRAQVVAGLPGFATVLAATYAAFYTRFSSQWTYVAEVYNSIKAAEYSTAAGNGAALAEWKAGFIEDCEDLHLARKPSLATTIHAWGGRKGRTASLCRPRCWWARAALGAATNSGGGSAAGTRCASCPSRQVHRR